MAKYRTKRATDPRQNLAEGAVDVGKRLGDHFLNRVATDPALAQRGQGYLTHITNWLEQKGLPQVMDRVDNTVANVANSQIPGAVSDAARTINKLPEYPTKVGLRVAGGLAGGQLGWHLSKALGRTALPDDRRVPEEERKDHWRAQMRNIAKVVGGAGAGIGGMYLADRYAMPLFKTSAVKLAAPAGLDVFKFLRGTSQPAAQPQQPTPSGNLANQVHASGRNALPTPPKPTAATPPVAPVPATQPQRPVSPPRPAAPPRPASPPTPATPQSLPQQLQSARIDPQVERDANARRAELARQQTPPVTPQSLPQQLQSARIDPRIERDANARRAELARQQPQQPQPAPSANLGQRGAAHTPAVAADWEAGRFPAGQPGARYIGAPIAPGPHANMGREWSSAEYDEGAANAALRASHGLLPYYGGLFDGPQSQEPVADAGFRDFTSQHNRWAAQTRTSQPPQSYMGGVRENLLRPFFGEKSQAPYPGKYTPVTGTPGEGLPINPFRLITGIKGVPSAVLPAGTGPGSKFVAAPTGGTGAGTTTAAILGQSADGARLANQHAEIPGFSQPVPKIDEAVFRNVLMQTPEGVGYATTLTDDNIGIGGSDPIEIFRGAVRAGVPVDSLQAAVPAELQSIWPEIKSRLETDVAPGSTSPSAGEPAAPAASFHDFLPPNADPVMFDDNYWSQAQAEALAKGMPEEKIRAEMSQIRATRSATLLTLADEPAVFQDPQYVTLMTKDLVEQHGLSQEEAGAAMQHMAGMAKRTSEFTQKLAEAGLDSPAGQALIAENKDLIGYSYKKHMQSFAMQHGSEKLGAYAAKIQSGQLDEEVFTVAGQALEKDGANPNDPGFLESMVNWFTSLEWPGQLAVMVGVPVAIAGAISMLAGGGMTGGLLGLAGAGLAGAGATGMLDGLFGGKAAPAAGGQQPAAGQPPAAGQEQQGNGMVDWLWNKMQAGTDTAASWFADNAAAAFASDDQKQQYDFINRTLASGDPQNMEFVWRQMEDKLAKDPNLARLAVWGTPMYKLREIAKSQGWKLPPAT